MMIWVFYQETFNLCGGVQFIIGGNENKWRHAESHVVSVGIKRNCSLNGIVPA